MEQYSEILQISALEWRCMWMTSDGSDTGCQIADFVVEHCSATIDYLFEGLRRVAEKWATARQRWGEVAKHELEAEFEEIWKGAFDYVEQTFTKWTKDAADSEDPAALHAIPRRWKIWPRSSSRSHRWRC